MLTFSEIFAKAKRRIEVSKKEKKRKRRRGGKERETKKRRKRKKMSHRGQEYGFDAQGAKR